MVKQVRDDSHVQDSSEAFFKGGKLAFALLLELEVNVESDKLLDVASCHRYASPILFELSLTDLAEALDISRESAAHDIFHLAEFGLVPIQHFF